VTRPLVRPSTSGELHYARAVAESGRVEGFGVARKYFAQSLELSKVAGKVVGNARAATGLLLAAAAFGEKRPDDAVNVAMGALRSTQHCEVVTTGLCLLVSRRDWDAWMRLR